MACGLGLLRREVLQPEITGTGYMSSSNMRNEKRDGEAGGSTLNITGTHLHLHLHRLPSTTGPQLASGCCMACIGDVCLFLVCSAVSDLVPPRRGLDHASCTFLIQVFVWIKREAQGKTRHMKNELMIRCTGYGFFLRKVLQNILKSSLSLARIQSISAPVKPETATRTGTARNSSPVPRPDDAAYEHLVETKRAGGVCHFLR